MYHSLPWLSAAAILLAACADTNSPVAPDAPADEPSAGPELRTTGPFPGRIAFVSTRVGGQADIYVMNADGTGLTRLTTFAGDERNPAWSWDNTKIAFTRDRAVGQNTTRSDIFVMNTDGTNGHWASPTPAFTSLSAAAWSPDGTWILAHSSTEGLMSINVATGALTHVTNNGANVAGLFPSFNPAGTKIVFDAPGGSVGIMNADGTGSITTIKRPSGDNVEFPSFSPDASKILLTVGTVGARDADIYALAGSTFTLVTSHGASHSASWAPDGKQIAFYTPQFNIARMAPDGSGRVRLTSSGTDFSPAYSH